MAAPQAREERITTGDRVIWDSARLAIPLI
jgi:hypothetical protein